MRKFLASLSIIALTAPAIAGELDAPITEFTGSTTEFTNEVTDFNNPVTEFEYNSSIVDRLTTPENSDLIESGTERVDTRLPRTERVITDRVGQEYSITDPNSVYNNQSLEEDKIRRVTAGVEKSHTVVREKTTVRGGGRTVSGFTYSK